ILTTEWGNVRYPSCRDKGRMWSREGALCLSWWQRDPFGDFVEQTGRTPTRTSTRPPHPHYPAPCPYRTLGRELQLVARPVGSTFTRTLSIYAHLHELLRVISLVAVLETGIEC